MTMPTTTTTFMNEGFQEIILGGLFKISKFAAVASQYLQSSYFDGMVAKNTAKLAISHYRKFGCCMSPTAFVREVQAKYGKKSPETVAYADYYLKVAGDKVVITDIDYILADLVNWIKVQRWKAFAADIATKLLPASDGPVTMAIRPTA